MDILQSKIWFAEKNLSNLDHPLKENAKKLLLISDFACKRVNLLQALLEKDACQSFLSRENYFTEVSRLSLQTSLNHFMRDLRIFRNTHFLRLLLLDLAKSNKTQDIMQSWSDCADAMILHCLAYCHHQASARFGKPRYQDKVAQLYTLGMGKLGGRELNYSSDIDLIFTFSNEGNTDGIETISNSHYFGKIVQQFIQIMQQVTADGFVFRVDLRLRPNGDSGPLVSSLAAMENYYQEQGRDWERYAMVKARVILERLDEDPLWFKRLIIPFVYRRYVDFSVIESLRSMKSLIESEVQLNPGLNDIKRGKGGIREIEFIIQNFQLVRGGRLPALQQQNALLALETLKQQQWLPRSDVLKNAYLFLRKLENALQSLADQQTHSLPEDPIKQAQISLAMGFPSWETLCLKWQQYQRIVSYSFRSVLGRVEAYEDEKRVLAKQLINLWHGHIEQDMAINLLTSLGYQNPTHCFQMIHAFRHGPRCRRLSQAARLRLDRFMVLLLTELIHSNKTSELLLQMMHLLENIIGRSAYLALLTENPKALKELLFWFATSPFITHLLVSQPFLLDILLEKENHWLISSRNQLEGVLLEQLSHAQDFEQQGEILREFKLMHWLMAARAEVQGAYESVRIGQFLADVAEVIVVQTANMAYKQLTVRNLEMKQIKSGFAIIAYGKLGSRELNYTSDLDLVFLHSARVEEEALVTRLTQKILHMLTTRTQTGILYAVDTRLRPSGASGLLVSHMDAFNSYQVNQAWTWEHQALLKARPIYAPLKIRQNFLLLKKTILALERDPHKLQEDVVNMRSKIVQNQDFGSLNQARSALLDLEFLVQYMVLDLRKPDLARYTHALSQMHHLFLAGVLTKKQFLILKKAYRRYHTALHQNILQAKLAQFPELSKELLGIFETIYKKGNSPGTSS